MAIQAELVRRLAELRVIAGAVHVVTGKARNARRYITLWTESFPCMRFLCTVPSAKMGKRRLPQRVILELPIIAKMQPDAIAHWPIIVFALDGTRERPTWEWHWMHVSLAWT